MLKAVHILVVEDSAPDRDLIVDILSEQSHSFPFLITEATDGEKAIEMLNSGLIQPNLIILDLNMPRVHGFDVLKMIRGSKGFASTPVVIFTTSQNTKDQAQSYSLGANAYVPKPFELDEFVASMRSLHEFWVEHARLPV